jgi:hypothetical protein
MKPLPLLLLSLLAALPAQVVRIANPGPEQTRWVVAPMPLAEADALPDVCLANGFLAVKARKVGVVSQVWHVRATVPGHGTLTLDDWQPLVGPLPEFEISPWITDAPERGVIRVGISVDGAWLCNLPLLHSTLVAESQVGQTYRFDRSAKGWHVTLFADFWSGQDAVDIRGAVVWSDPTPNRPWSIADVSVRIETFGYEPLTLDNAKLNGHVEWAPGRWIVYRGPLPHGTGIPFSGALLPQDDGSASRPPVTFAEQLDAHMRTSFDALRREQLAAAVGGPLVAAAAWYDTFGPFGLTPDVAALDDPAQVRARMSAPACSRRSVRSRIS